MINFQVSALGEETWRKSASEITSQLHTVSKHKQNTVEPQLSSTPLSGSLYFPT